jgi:diguanylate cyclase (GGDEF)-like protein
MKRVRIRPLLAGMAATMSLYAIDLVFHPLPHSISEPFQKFVTPAMCFGAAALCVMRARSSRQDGTAWWLYALAMGLWGLGQTYWVIFLWSDANPPFPSPADAAWLSFYLPAYLALYLMLRRWSGSAWRARAGLDALIGGLGVGAAGAAFAFQEVLSHTSGSTAATATNLAYPIGDLGLLALAVAAITFTGWTAAGVLRWIAAALAIYAVTDSIYLVQVAEQTYHAGDLVDFGWPAAALVVGIASGRSNVRAPSAARTTGTVVLPVLFGFAALTLLVVDHFVRTNLLALSLATASISVIIVRLYLTAQDNRRRLDQSRREAATDVLTGLPNRRAIENSVTRMVAHARRTVSPLAAVMVDLDDFKAINDTWGHDQGDAVLAEAGDVLTATLRGSDFVGRSGGEEFLVLLPDTGGDTAVLVAEKLRAAIATIQLPRVRQPISASLGVAVYPDMAGDSDALLRLADSALYAAKNNGRNRVELADGAVSTGAH